MHIDPFFEAVIKSNIDVKEFIEKNDSTTLKQKEQTRGAGGDFSTFVDIEAEKIFIKNLLSFGSIYSEECGFVQGSGNDEIIIDPIDGSDNFLADFPYYGTSVARKRDGKCIQACIVNLANNDIFIKDSKNFFYANLYSLAWKKVTQNKDSQLGIFERSYCHEEYVKILHNNNIKFRSPGAFALSLAYAHNVDFVLYVGPMRSYDIEAGLYMCENLNKIYKDDFLFVSKDKEIFDKMSQFI